MGLFGLVIRMTRAFLLLFVLFLIFKNTRRDETVVYISNWDVENDKARIDSLLDIMCRIGIRNPVVAVAQAYLETGNFQSEIFRFNHNSYGMKYRQDSKYAIGEKRGHAYYKDELDSFLDFKNWQDRSMGNRVMSDKEYLNHLNNPWKDGRRYAEDPLYTQKLLIIIQKINKARTVAPPC